MLVATWSYDVAGWRYLYPKTLQIAAVLWNRSAYPRIKIALFCSVWAGAYLGGHKAVSKGLSLGQCSVCALDAQEQRKSGPEEIRKTGWACRGLFHFHYPSIYLWFLQILIIPFNVTSTETSWFYIRFLFEKYEKLLQIRCISNSQSQTKAR